MKRFLVLALYLCCLMACSNCYAQPYDLLYPTDESPDTLSRELRDLHDIERDLAIEKLTREPNKVDAYLELADLRRRQGKLQESKRFYEMALKISPDNFMANQGLMMVHYQLGEFQDARNRMDTVITLESSAMDERNEFNKFRKRLQEEGSLGISIYEDDRDLTEIMYYFELMFPSTEYTKLKTNFRYEKWNFEDNKYEMDLDVLQAGLRYDFNENSHIQGTYAPELFSKSETINGYSFDALAGNDNFKLALKYSFNAFKENIYTLHNRYEEKETAIAIYGDLHPKTRLVQTVTLSEISDDNSKRRYETEVIHSIFRKKMPFLTASLRFYQSSYEFQTDVEGNFLNYWAPSDYKGGEFTLSWEKNVGSKFWWGVDAKYTYNQYRFDTDDDVNENGVGGSIYLNYKLAGGNVFASFGDRINKYFRERRLDVQGVFKF